MHILNTGGGVIKDVTWCWRDGCLVSNRFTRRRFSRRVTHCLSLPAPQARGTLQPGGNGIILLPPHPIETLPTFLHTQFLPFSLFSVLYLLSQPDLLPLSSATHGERFSGESAACGCDLENTLGDSKDAAKTSHKASDTWVCKDRADYLGVRVGRETLFFPLLRTLRICTFLGTMNYWKG